MRVREKWTDFTNYFKFGKSVVNHHNSVCSWYFMMYTQPCPNATPSLSSMHVEQREIMLLGLSYHWFADYKQLGNLKQCNTMPYNNQSYYSLKSIIACTYTEFHIKQRLSLYWIVVVVHSSKANARSLEIPLDCD